MRRSSVVIKIAFGSTALGAGVLGVAITASAAQARLDLYVDKSAQQMSVIQNGALLYVWPVSTGHDRHSAPSGVYTPERLERSWFSKAYYNAPMPHAIFFHNGYAIHGSRDISKVGGPASYGCIRLHPHDAALLFSMVQRAGPSNTAIFVGGDSRPPSLRYHNFDDQAPLARLRDDGMARGAYPPEPVMLPPRAGADPYVDAYPPGPPPQSGPRMSPYYPAPPVDGRGAYPAGPDAPGYYEPDRYGDDGRSVPRGPSVGPYGNVDGRYVDGRDAPRGPRLPPDYRADPQVDGRMASHSPRTQPDDNIDPYVDGRGVPYSPAIPPYYPPDRRADARGGVHPQPEPGPRPPYDAIDRYADGPARQHGDQFTMRGNYPAPRLQAPRPDGEAERIPHNSARPMAAGAAGTKPKLEARSELRSEPKPGRLADAPSGRRLTVGEAAKAPAPPIPAPAVPTPQPATMAPPAPAARAEPPQERPQPDVGYRVLPRSYWAGASWRWRIKRDEDGFPHDP
jgi:hypothetical protein